MIARTYSGGRPTGWPHTITRKDTVYLKMAEEIASLSKDENTKVGSIIIDKDGKVVSMGYNGCASKFGLSTNKDDKIVPHTREEESIQLKTMYSFLENKPNETFKANKYPFMIHAEQNALLTTSDMNRLNEATIYCTHYPCSTCANLIAQAGIKHVKVLDNRHGTFEETIVPTLFVYENMGISLTVFQKEKI